ncbi:MAG: pyridoxamine 5'-phosphate oxidase family protein [Lachnospiraceae bacterium]
MLVGTMEVLQDAEIKQELWHPGDTMYYSGGVTDPDYCVLKFTAVKGRHYCALSDNTHRHLNTTAAKSCLSGWTMTKIRRISRTAA